MGLNLKIEPEEGEKSEKIVVYAGYSKIEYSLPYSMYREEIVNKILSDVEFRNRIKEDLSEREFRILMDSI